MEGEVSEMNPPPTYEEMRAARAEHARVYALNKPHWASNKAIRLRNWERRQGLREGEPEPWIEYVKPEAWAEAAYEDEQAWKLFLGQREPGVWRDLVLALPEHLRQPAANVIWWDWFGDRSLEDRWPHLDEWLTVSREDLFIKDTPEMRGEIELALQAVGYSGWMAHTRARGGWEDCERLGERAASAGKERRVNGGKYHGREGRRFERGRSKRDWGMPADYVALKGVGV